MAVIKSISSKANPKKINEYLTQEEKTEEKLISGKDCSPENVVNEFDATKELYGKNSSIKYHHVIQSFSPDDNITPDKAHELGKELANSQFKDFEVLIVTHKDKEHIHNHFVVNSVSFEDGKKYNSSQKKLWDIKRESNRLCEREGLKTLDLDKKAKERLTSSELRIELRGGECWKKDLKECIDFSKQKTNSFEEFRSFLKEKFEIETRCTNKSISYKHPDKEKPIRGTKLGTDYDKEELQNEFTRKEKGIIGTREEGSREQTNGNSTNVDWSAIRDNVQGEGNRVSEQFSNDVAGEIQQQVRRVKERTDRAIGEIESKDRGIETGERGSESESKITSRESKPKSRERDFDFER